MSDRKSVCFTFGTSDDSGAGRMGYYFARGFLQQGWCVTAICPPPPKGQASVIERLIDTGVNVETVSPFGGRLDLGLLSQFKEHLVRKGSRLVVSMHQQDMKFAGLASLWANVPWIVSGQNTFTFSGGPLRRRIAAGILRHILRSHCTGVVATSQRVAGEFRGLLGYRGSLEIQPNGVDTLVFKGSPEGRDGIRRDLGVDPEARVFVSVGRITQQKNQLGLVEAFSHAYPKGASGSDGFHLWMVGSPALGTPDEAYRQEVESRIAAFGLTNRAKITGWRTDIPHVLSAADIYVQPSLWEGSPLAVLEAMSCGLPVIVADNGGVLPEFRDGKHGWVVTPGDVRSLEVALRGAGNLDRAGLSARGHVATELVKARYDAASVATRFYELTAQWMDHR